MKLKELRALRENSELVERNNSLLAMIKAKNESVINLEKEVSKAQVETQKVRNECRNQIRQENLRRLAADKSMISQAEAIPGARSTSMYIAQKIKNAQNITSSTRGGVLTQEQINNSRAAT